MNCNCKLHKLKWIRTSNPALQIRQGFVAYLHISIARGITGRSQQLTNELFWEYNLFWQHYIGTPIEMERWSIILKQAILAKEGISIDILREASPDKVTSPLNLSLK